jgi:hypothetical protein
VFDTSSEGRVDVVDPEPEGDGIVRSAVVDVVETEVEGPELKTKMAVTESFGFIELKSRSIEAGQLNMVGRENDDGIDLGQCHTQRVGRRSAHVMRFAEQVAGLTLSPR